MNRMNRLVKGIVVALLLGSVASAVGLSIWAGIRAAEVVGPTVMKSDVEGNIWLLFDRDLYRLNPEGAVTKILSLDTLRVEGVADFLPELSGGLLVGDARRKQILRYREDGSVVGTITLRERSTESSSGTFKFDVDRATGRMFVADTTLHMIRVFDADGRSLGSFGKQGEASTSFHFPNRITVGPDGLLYIADTNNHRIMIYRPDGQITALSTSLELTGPYVWPTSLALGLDSSIVVVNKDSALRTGNLLVLDRPTGRIRTVDLSAGAEPESVIVRASDMLVSDPGRMMIARFSHDGRFLGTFGDLILLTRFHEAAQTRERCRQIQSWSQFLLVGILIALIAVLYMGRYKKTKAEPPEFDPLAHRISLRPPIVDSVSLGWRRIYLWIIGVAYAAVAWLAVAIVAIQRNASGRPLQTPEIERVLVINAVALMIIVTTQFIWAGVARHGMFIKGRLKLERQLFSKYQSILSRLLAPDERLVSYTLGATFPTVFTIGPTFVVVTTERLLLLRKACWGSRIQCVRAIHLNGLRAVETTFPRRWRFWLAKQAGAGFLLIRCAGSHPITLIFPRAAQAEEMKSAIGAQGPTSRMMPGIFEICTRCLTTVAPNGARCPGCSLQIASRKRALVWSLVYPGLGQLANHHLLKACLFLLLGTNVMTWLGFQLMALYGGTAEVPIFEFVNGFGWVVLIWLISAQDAYYAAR